MHINWNIVDGILTGNGNIKKKNVEKISIFWALTNFFFVIRNLNKKFCTWKNEVKQK